MNRLIAIILLLLVSPIFLLVAAGALLLQGRPIFFVSERAGKHGEPFMLFKFRTMVPVDSTNDGNNDAVRVTRFGNFLRSTSLDEIPQLLNIVRGDMKFIGPRPLLCDYNALYSNGEKIRLKVSPGITGLAQVMGRNSISWRRKFVLDAYYVRNKSIKLNIFVLWKTLLTVLGRSGVNASGDTTMDRFSGNDQGK